MYTFKDLKTIKDNFNYDGKANDIDIGIHDGWWF